MSIQNLAVANNHSVCCRCFTCTNDTMTFGDNVGDSLLNFNSAGATMDFAHCTVLNFPGGTLPQPLGPTDSPTFNGLTLSSLTPKGIVQTGASDSLISTALTNGQLLIGNTGNLPTASTLTGSGLINIANGAGSITISNSASYYYASNTSSQNVGMGNPSVMVQVGTTILSLNIGGFSSNSEFLMPVGIYEVEFTVTSTTGGSIGFGVANQSVPSLCAITYPATSTISQSLIFNNTNSSTFYGICVPAAQANTITYVSLMINRIN